MIYGTLLFNTFQICTQIAPNIVLKEFSALMGSSLGCKNVDVRYLRYSLCSYFQPLSGNAFDVTTEYFD